MMTIKKQVPNTITLLNLFCGCIAMVFALKNDFEMAFYFVSLGIFLDFFDGFFARLFQVSSPLGLQLDSLADMVTSGVVPGIVMYQMMGSSSGFPKLDWIVEPFPFVGFLITLGSCYRLANFNIDTRQTDSFIGLPTPANALFILSLPLVLRNLDSFFVLELLTNPFVLIGITLLSVYMLNAEIPLFSLKMKQMSIKKNALQIGFLLSSVVLIAGFQYAGIPLLIVLYVLLSVITNVLASK